MLKEFHLETFAPPQSEELVSGEIVRDGRVLTCTFELRGLLDDFEIDEHSPLGQCDGLWQKTCFELFVKGCGQSSYVELNAAPSKAWNVYGFSGYRQLRTEAERPEEPQIFTTRYQESFQLIAEMDLGWALAVVDPEVDWEVGINAVVRHGNGYLGYHALAHHDDKPDFHSQKNFSLILKK